MATGGDLGADGGANSANELVRPSGDFDKDITLLGGIDVYRTDDGDRSHDGGGVLFETPGFWFNQGRPRGRFLSTGRRFPFAAHTPAPIRMATTTDDEFKPPAADDFKVAPDSLDEHGFATVWNIVSETVGDDLTQVREVAGRLMGFLCKHDCDFILTSSANAEYLDGKFEQDKKLLHDWKSESEMVDIITQHAEVHFETLKLFLANRRYKPDANYSPTRANRKEWFENTWKVG